MKYSFATSNLSELKSMWWKTEKKRKEKHVTYQLQRKYFCVQSFGSLCEVTHQLCTIK